jgi:hypothetical protein
LGAPFILGAIRLASVLAAEENESSDERAHGAH